MMDEITMSLIDFCDKYNLSFALLSNKPEDYKFEKNGVIYENLDICKTNPETKEVLEIFKFSMPAEMVPTKLIEEVSVEWVLKELAKILNASLLSDGDFENFKAGMPDWFATKENFDQYNEIAFRMGEFFGAEAIHNLFLITKISGNEKFLAEYLKNLN